MQQCVAAEGECTEGNIIKIQVFVVVFFQKFRLQHQSPDLIDTLCVICNFVLKSQKCTAC